MEKQLVSKFKKILEIVDKFKNVDPVLTNFEINFDVLPISVEDSGRVVIPVGTPRDKAGISIMKDDSLVMFYKGKDPVTYMWVSEVKDIIKSRWADLNRTTLTTESIMSVIDDIKYYIV